MAPDRVPEPIAVALAIARELERLDVPYVAVGSLASSVHGEPRSTDDLDFLVDLSVPAAERLVAALQPTYYVSRDAAIAAAQQPRDGAFNAIHLAAALKVDLFVVGEDDFPSVARRARRAAGAGRPTRQSSAHRAGGTAWLEGFVGPGAARGWGRIGSEETCPRDSRSARCASLENRGQHAAEPGHHIFAVKTFVL